MKIQRQIEVGGTFVGVEYELTGIELERCMNEAISRHDMDKISDHLDDLEYHDVPEEVVSDLASQFRTAVDAAMEDIIRNVFRINEDNLEQYKEKYRVFLCEVTQTKTHTYSIRAKDAQEAEDMLNRYFDHHEVEVESDMEDEEGDYDFGWMNEDENWGDPDTADITEERGC